MKGPDRLKYFQGNWPTNKGAWFPGEKVLYREKSLFDDFSDKPWMALLIYGVRNILPRPGEANLVEHIWKICTSFPDPRLWNNRVAALAGSVRTSGALAVSASTAVSEASIYGRRPDIQCADFLQMANKNKEHLEDIIFEYLKKYRVVPGFGRPIISKDERIIPLLREARSLDFNKGDHLLLIKEIEDILIENRYRMKANISAFCAALMLDLGYKPRDFYLMSILSFSAGIMPCYVDGLEKKEGVIFPLGTENIEYKGEGCRRFLQ